MGVRIGSTFSTTFIGPLPASAAETIVHTTGPMGLAVDNAAVFIGFMFSCNPGTSTTSFVLRVRRGASVTSPFIGVNPWIYTCIAGSIFTASGWYVDTPGVTAGLLYTLTVVQTGATVAGGFQDGSIEAFVL